MDKAQGMASPGPVVMIYDLVLVIGRVIDVVLLMSRCLLNRRSSDMSRTSPTEVSMPLYWHDIALDGCQLSTERRAGC